MTSLHTYNAVEQQLERAVRLLAFQDLEPEEHRANLPHRRLERDQAALEVTLSGRMDLLRPDEDDAARTIQ